MYDSGVPTNLYELVVFSCFDKFRVSLKPFVCGGGVIVLEDFTPGSYMWAHSQLVFWGVPIVWLDTLIIIRIRDFRMPALMGVVRRRTNILDHRNNRSVRIPFHNA